MKEAAGQGKRVKMRREKKSRIKERQREFKVIATKTEEEKNVRAKDEGRGELYIK